ncbi:hypothetical protein R69608_05536 [Paraburkholderia nemoris]|uniref:helix-turn-helix domain-containing protein n=1 Tax=Paraburkholderia nemoris TaxID=2793076 RepID=UPI0019125287|nr:helix-turn-helix domain-containing protein [Paraburkholderia nemoris]MBK5150555.1 helix-turn-helix domain-containing protein [Burkholderia sp. R-69608]CAE6946238.1 hypothetical protein R69608_05536 [Paraburkholderia nemoris]
MAQNKKAATRKSAAKESVKQQYSNDATAQRNRILAALRTHGSLTTLEARRRLDVLHPAARVMELRDAGFLISTVWSVDHNELGSQHRVARYHLLSEPQAEAL